MWVYNEGTINEESIVQNSLTVKSFKRVTIVAIAIIMMFTAVLMGFAVNHASATSVTYTNNYSTLKQCQSSQASIGRQSGYTITTACHEYTYNCVAYNGTYSCSRVYQFTYRYTY